MDAIERMRRFRRTEAGWLSSLRSLEYAAKEQGYIVGCSSITTVPLVTLTRVDAIPDDFGRIQPEFSADTLNELHAYLRGLRIGGGHEGG